MFNNVLFVIKESDKRPVSRKIGFSIIGRKTEAYCFTIGGRGCFLTYDYCCCAINLVKYFFAKSSNYSNTRFFNKEFA